MCNLSSTAFGVNSSYLDFREKNLIQEKRNRYLTR